MLNNGDKMNEELIKKIDELIKIKIAEEAIRFKLIEEMIGRKSVGMFEDMGVQGKVQVGVRKWNPDPNGKEIAQDGQKGYYGPWTFQEAFNLLTNGGRDFLHQQGYKTTGLATNGGNWIALSSDTNAPSATDTTLAGEYTTVGLSRAQGTVTHVTGNTTSTVQYTFTATGTATAVQKSALFAVQTAGTMVHENTFSSVNLANNDQLSVAWTITLS